MSALNLQTSPQGQDACPEAAKLVFDPTPHVTARLLLHVYRGQALVEGVRDHDGSFHIHVAYNAQTPNTQQS